MKQGWARFLKDVISKAEKIDKMRKFLIANPSGILKQYIQKGLGKRYILEKTKKYNFKGEEGGDEIRYSNSTFKIKITEWNSQPKTIVNEEIKKTIVNEEIRDLKIGGKLIQTENWFKVDWQGPSMYEVTVPKNVTSGQQIEG